MLVVVNLHHEDAGGSILVITVVMVMVKRIMLDMLVMIKVKVKMKQVMIKVTCLNQKILVVLDMIKFHYEDLKMKEWIRRFKMRRCDAITKTPQSSAKSRGFPGCFPG